LFSLLSLLGGTGGILFRRGGLLRGSGSLLLILLSLLRSLGGSGSGLLCLGIGSLSLLRLLGNQTGLLERLICLRIAGSSYRLGCHI